jgi:hypothetical protein
VSSAIVIAAICIGLNTMLSALASWLEQRPFVPRERRPLELLTSE